MKRVQQAGFTLMELMIVIAIIGVLAAISFPSYQEYVIRGNRTEAMALLNEAAARQARYYAQNNVYADTAEKLNMADYVDSLSYYGLVIDNVTASTYTLTAANIRAPQTGDKKCKSFILDQAGTKGVEAGATSTAAECWK